MAITYKWRIHALDTDVSKDSKDNVVKTIHWGLEATEGTDPVYHANSLGTHDVVYDKDDFLAYADLTKAKVISWLEDAEKGIDVATTKSGLDAAIELQKTPVEKTFHNPFNEE